MGKDTEMREATAELGENISKAEDSKGVFKALSSYLWKNVFPILVLGIFGVGVNTELGVANSASDAHERVTAIQVDHGYRMTAIEANADYRQKWAQEAVARLAAEGAALRKLLEEAQVVIGIMEYRLDRLDRERRTQGPAMGPPAAAGDPEGGHGPAAVEAVDFNELLKRLKEELGKRPKVNPDDINRYLQGQSPIQAPLPPRPIKGRFTK